MASSKINSSGSANNVFASVNWPNLYLDNSTADVYFLCGMQKESIPAHKVVLSNASPVFYNMFFEKSNKLGVRYVELPESVPSETFKEFLKLFYLDEVNFGESNIMEIVGLMEKYGIPHQRFLYEANIPPAQDSPKNIVNSLNNDCLQAVLRKLDNVQDYFNAAQVCSHFQNNAQEAYPPKLKSVKVDNKQCGQFDLVTSTMLNDFLRIFGSSLKSIDWKYHVKSEQDIFTMIAKYCGESLRELSVINSSEFRENLHLQHRYPFKALEKVTLDRCSIISKVDIYKQLKSLTLTGMKEPYIRQCFPKLEHFVSKSFTILGDELNTFLILNPQLKKLEVDKLCEAASCFKNIANYGQHLETLSMDVRHYEHTDDIALLGRLKNLKSFSFLNVYGDAVPFNNLLDAFASNDVRIENLQLQCYSGVWDEATTESVTKLTFLEKLELKTISEEQLIHIARYLPKLKEIAVFGFGTQFGIAGIIKILKIGQNLTTLRICDNFCPGTITLEDYEHMLALVKGRIRLTMRTTNKIPIHVPEDVLDANREWLNISCLENRPTVFVQIVHHRNVPRPL